MAELTFLVLVVGLLALAARAGGARVGIALGVWLGLLALIAWSGFLTNYEALPPRLPLVALPALIGVVLLARRTETLPLGWLIGFQSFRVVMELVLWQLFREGRVPVQMTFEGQNFDILVGLSAPLVAWGVTKWGWSHKALALWNFASLLLLVNIVVIAVLSVPGPLRQFHNEPANTIVASWPFIWLPGFVVPCALFGHLSVTRILRRKSRTTSPEA